MKLSNIIAGTMSWGSWGKQYNTKAMQDLIHTCVSNGITTFDHADIYGDYTTEAEFGTAFKSSGVQRGNVQFITKCGIQHTKGRANTVKHYDYSAEYIIWSVENSLQNLNTDYIDVLLLHRPSPLMEVDSIATAITQLQQQGKLLQFGVSNFTPMQTSLIQQVLPVSYNQIQCSLTHYDALTDGSLTSMQVNKVIPMSWNPLGSYYKEDSPQVQRIKSVLDVLVNKYNTSADVLLLAWLLKHPAGIVPVVGSASSERIQQYQTVESIKLELTDWFILWEASMGSRVP